MKVVIQRAKDAKVTINNKVTGKIDAGYVILVGLKTGDTEEVIDKMCDKIINLRIFEDENEKMNYSIKDVNGKILSISQFTLYAKHNGRRPSFSDAMKYNDAKEIYKYFNDKLKELGMIVEEGIFGEDMKVSFTNDGPVTIIIDSAIDF